MTVWLMSDAELTRLEVLRDLDQEQSTSEAATRLLGLEPSGVLAVEGIPDRGSGRPDLEATRALQQPA